MASEKQNQDSSDVALTDLGGDHDGEAPQPQSEFMPRACLTLVGAFLAMFCTVGFINAFGVFQEYYASSMLSNKSASDIAWIGSVNLFVMYVATLPVGYLSDKYGPKNLLIIGSVTMLFALFMTSLCHQYRQLFLAQAFLLGIGLSFAVLPAFAIVPRHFARGRGLAMGITVSGSSLGGIIWPIALRKLLNDVGFGWGVRTCAFIMLPLLAFSCFAIRLPEIDQKMMAGVKHKPDFSVFKNPVLIFLALGLFFIYLGLFGLLFYITTYTISLGLNANMAFYMISVVNAASLFGRIIPGFLADKIGAYNILILSAGFSGITCACWTLARSIPAIVILSLAYGFSSGAAVSLQGACAAQVVKREQYGLALGSVMSFLSLAALIGSPINGQLLGKFGYLGLSLFSGLAMLLGMLFIIIARLNIASNVFIKA